MGQRVVNGEVSTVTAMRAMVGVQVGSGVVAYEQCRPRRRDQRSEWHQHSAARPPGKITTVHHAE